MAFLLHFLRRGDLLMSARMSAFTPFSRPRPSELMS
jgi:hypothetical protein